MLGDGDLDLDLGSGFVKESDLGLGRGGGSLPNGRTEAPPPPVSARPGGFMLRQPAVAEAPKPNAPAGRASGAPPPPKQAAPKPIPPNQRHLTLENVAAAAAKAEAAAGGQPGGSVFVGDADEVSSFEGLLNEVRSARAASGWVPAQAKGPGKAQAKGQAKGKAKGQGAAAKKKPKSPQVQEAGSSWFEVEVVADAEGGKADAQVAAVTAEAESEVEAEAITDAALEETVEAVAEVEAEAEAEAEAESSAVEEVVAAGGASEVEVEVMKNLERMLNGWGIRDFDETEASASEGASEAAMTVTPTRAQAAAALPIGNGEDVVVVAPTGSGKTLAFLLPTIGTLNPDSTAVQLLIITPGRELSAQIAAVCAELFQGTGLKALSLIGGANINRQIENLKKKRPQVVVGTPGRLAELALGQRKLKLGTVRTVIMDEVDAMLDGDGRGGGGKMDPEVTSLLKAVGPSTQHILASATGALPETRAALEAVVGRKLTVCGLPESMYDPTQVDPSKKPTPTGVALPLAVAHGVHVTSQPKMLTAIRSLLYTEPNPELCLVFVSDSHRVKVVCGKLLQMGIIAAPLHGEQDKDERTDVMRRLAKGTVGLVVTTELAARGLDAPLLTHVINLDLPTDATHYAHRAGRVGRAGRPGIVVSLATPQTQFILKRFAKTLDVKIPSVSFYANRLLEELDGEKGGEATGAEQPGSGSPAVAEPEGVGEKVAN